MPLILLLGLHHFADIYQPSWLIENKKKHLFAHYEHAFCYAFIISMGLIALDLFEPWKFFFIFVGHATIDISFYILLPKMFKKCYNWVWIDQFLHYLQILSVWM